MKYKVLILEGFVNGEKPTNRNDWNEIFVQVKDLEEADIQRIIKAVNNIEDVKK